jgi:DNA-binding HxlR family transcriptional regulator
VDRVSSVEPNVLSQTCESRQALDRIADKWTCLIV